MAQDFLGCRECEKVFEKVVNSDSWVTVFDDFVANIGWVFAASAQHRT